MSISIRHTGIVVKDLDAWLDFLIEELNFKIWIDQIEKGEFISNLLGIKNTEVRTIKLRDSNSGIIELLKFNHPVHSEARTDSTLPNSLGITHIALQVDSVVQLEEKLNRKGYKSISPAAISTDKAARVCYVWGPEMVLFELVELI
jgi:catechol 2,3-dioxygenase-like lactoylglutathione lyase family enzyme